MVVEGVRQRMTGTPSPDPLLLINFPDIDTQFKVHLLEDTNTLKLTLAQNDIDSEFTLSSTLSVTSPIALQALAGSRD